MNLNDGTVEGLAEGTRPICSVQYHPEAAPDPHDAVTWSRDFREMVRRTRGEKVTGRRLRPASLSATREPMPRREDIKIILVIGSGPIVIGQACEFDYSGTQACKALREEGYEVVLVNSNPATIMTDPELADRTYIEPLTVEIVGSASSRARRPDALLPTLGGQTALNLAMALRRARRPGDVRRRADRRQPRGDPARPRTASCSRGDAARSASTLPRSGVAHTARRGPADRRRASASPPSSGRPSRWAARAAASPTTPRSSTDLVERGLAAVAAPPDPDRGERARLEGIRARGDARPRRTTSSSSARSRTSTRWASTPATRSPWRRPRR